MLKGRYNRQRRARPRTQTFNRLIPNIITVGALCAGLTAVRFAIAEQWEFAMVAVVVAAIFDALDGTIARLLKAASDFGAELDSLSDVIAFGVAPGLIIYFWSLSEIGGIGWAAGLFFAVCCALRLARFNSTLEMRPRYANNFFTGVPAPGGALLALLPLLMSREFGDGFFRHPAVTGPWIVLIALLMVSQIPTYSLKRLRVPQRYFLPMLVLIGLLGAGLAGAPWHTLLILSLVYLGSFPFSYRSFKRLKAEARAEENDVDESETEVVNEEGGDEAPSTHLREV
ncbi:MAG: CDP-diacylglycerol--serine O-phosphatidyltransferase [Pseudomonadota bacterium]|nr:CDP-diacylglycerol--serine O-phosphatidyltransferase [Pseudomonadota bacterium]